MRIRCLHQRCQHPRVEKGELSGERQSAFAGGKDGDSGGAGNAGFAVNEQVPRLRRGVVSARKVDHRPSLFSGKQRRLPSRLDCLGLLWRKFHF